MTNLEYATEWADRLKVERDEFVRCIAVTVEDGQLSWEQGQRALDVGAPGYELGKLIVRKS